ncbi:MAG: TonB-dependent receptor [Gammaproteobacteria bacterium]|nr:TonB-dependent receptor [Gammaproteobacteria bacterium]MBT8151150.1 TonB-dependent receptor [Gammaproteobacteria bacterium]NND39310.1 TonB-dependent receptor [Pseudomonadales bacterium]NNM11646.1 TonB-dependent receptor [Pseudomonadales bacterium]
MALLLVAPGANAQDNAMEEVVVEGDQSGTQILDDLVSVSALDAEKLADAGIENVEDVAAYVPNLVLTQTETGTNIFIRGIGAGVNQGFDQSVGLFSDGVPLPRSNMARAPFLDLAGVQVKRGPQYILDGNYAIAGSVHMISNLAVDEFKAGVDINYIPSQGDRTALLTIGGPISEHFSANAVFQRKKANGYTYNVYKNQDEMQKDDTLGRLVIGFRPSENVSFKLKAELGEFNTVGRSVETILDLPTPNPGVTGRLRFDPNEPLVTRDARTKQPAEPWVTEADRIYAPQFIDYDISVNQESNVSDNPTRRDFYYAGKTYVDALAHVYNRNQFPTPAGLKDIELDYQRATDAPEFSENKSSNFTLVSNFYAGEHKFTSTSSFITYEFDESIDTDFTPVPFLLTEQYEEYDQFFQSITYESPADAFIQWQAGMWYAQTDLTYGDDIFLILTEREFINETLNPINFEFYEDQAARTKPDPIRAYIGYRSAGGFLPVGASTIRPTRRFDQEGDLFASYLQAKVNFTDLTRATLGMRYTYSKKTATRDQAFVFRNTGELFTRQDVTNEVDPNQNLAIRQGILFLSNFLGIQGHSCRYEPDVYPEVTPGFPSFDDCIGPHDPEFPPRREEALYPSFTLEHDVNTDLTLMGAFRVAGKLGGYDARSVARPDVVAGRGIPFGTFEFEDEIAQTFEIGARWYLPNGLGQLFATAFYTDFTDLQVSRFDGKTGFVVDNAGKANTKGIEMEGMLLFTDKFNMTYSLAWIDFTFKDFPLGACHLGRRPDFYQVSEDAARTAFSTLLDGSPIPAGPLPIVYNAYARIRPGSESSIPFNNVQSGINAEQFATLNIGAANPYSDQYVESFGANAWNANGKLLLPAFCDFKGQTNQFVAEWQGTFSFNYENEIRGLGVFRPTLDLLYNSGYHTSTSQDPLVAQDKFLQLNGRLELASFEDTWTVAVTGENITNEKIVSYSNDTPIGSRLQGARGFIGFTRPPRSIGVNLRYNLR